ncbi:MAG: ribonuclease HII [Deltaproteobacteria bacterium]|nr:ribonuclease HII [Deltaproteobacteria bacterium]
MAARIAPRLHSERDLWRSGLRLVAGVDEVGMGPLAGPVVAAAVIFSPHHECDDDIPAVLPQGVRDSKMLTLKARERLDTEIRQVAFAVGIGMVEVEEIDRINIYQAGLRAMRLALDHLPVFPEHVLVDGRTLKNLPCPCSVFIKGDRDVYSIAAASILAKVYRDRLMIDLDRQYPEYGFARHMGYGTVAHRDALRRFGPTPVHRRSFRLL